MIQFALSWYWFPPEIRLLLFNYYNLLMACVQVPGSSEVTKPFQFAVGVFQGCTASTIIFNITFNLLLDYLVSVLHLGYQLSWSPMIIACLLFADDLTLLA